MGHYHAGYGISCIEKPGRPGASSALSLPAVSKKRRRV